MNTVRFSCAKKNLFILNFEIKTNSVPNVGDIIKASNNHFTKATYRVKPWSKDPKIKHFKNSIYIEFTVVSREFSLSSNEWDLNCEPTSDSLLFLLESIKTI